MPKKSTPWVKWFPDKFLHGVSDLEANEILVYVIALNLIYDKQGPWPYNPKRLAARCKLRQSVVESAVDDLIAEGKLLLIDGHLTNEKAAEVIGERQGASEKATAASNARWQAESVKDKENNGSEDADASTEDQKNDAIEKGEGRKEKKKKATPKKAPPAPPAALELDGGPDKSPARMAFDLYNEVAQRIGGMTALSLTDERRKKLNARMNGKGFVVWQEAMEKVERSLFLCGEAPSTKRGERPFQLNLDMLLRPENFQRLLEDFYGLDREPRAKEGSGPTDWSSERWRRILTVYDHSGDWPDEAGPEPGQPGYLGPSTGDTYDRQ